MEHSRVSGTERVIAVDSMTAFAANLKQLRKKHRLSQAELGQKIGYTEKAVSKWERGVYVPDVHVLMRLASEFHVSLNDLFDKGDTRYYLGIDGGGTKTAFLLEDEEGHCVKRTEETGCNPNDIGLEKAKEILRAGIEKTCDGIPLSKIAVFAGIAGAGIETNRQALKAYLDHLSFASATVGSDIENILAVGLDGQDGIAMIMGTGVLLYCLKDGRAKRMMGWGYFFDEGGSAFNFGRDALSQVFATADGRMAPTPLTKMVMGKADCSTEELLNRSYALGKRYVAGFAECVFRAAKAGDGTAQAIIERNMAVVAGALACAAKPFGDQTPSVVIAGGLTKEPDLIAYLQNALPPECRCRFHVLSEEPVCGAIRLARKYGERLA